MKNKVPLALIEILLMLLVFALAAAICLKTFAWVDEKSEDIRVKNEAVIQVQNVAEMLKYTNGDIDRCIETLDGEWQIKEGKLIGEYDDTVIMVKFEERQIDGLSGASITAYNHNEREIFGVDVSWQTSLEGGLRYEN